MTSAPHAAGISLFNFISYTYQYYCYTMLGLYETLTTHIPGRPLSFLYIIDKKHCIINIPDYLWLVQSEKRQFPFSDS